MKTIFTCLFLLSVSISVSAQSAALKQNTQWLEKMMNMLVKDDDKKGMDVNGKKSKPEFKFNNCQMAMNVEAKDESFSMGFHLNWLLKDVRKVSYQKDKDGYYTLLLDVPADKIKMNMGFGNDNSISGSFNLSEDDKKKKEDDHTSFSLTTKDEKLVQEMVRKFESSISECQKK